MALRTDLPTLAEGPVVLRPWQPEDASAIVAAIDEEVARFLPVRWPYSLDDAQAYLRGEAWPDHEGPAASWAITEAGDDTLAGSIGVHLVDAEERVAHAGYWLAASARGRGIAAAALRLTTDWARAEWDLRRVELLISPDNARSQGVARRAGFTKTHRTRQLAIGGELRVHEVWGRDCDRDRSAER